MVVRILKYELSSPTANGTDQEMGNKSPPSGKTWDVQGIYSDQTTEGDYSLVLEERKLFDNVPGDELPDEDNVLPVNLTVREGEDLSVLVTETAGNTNAKRFYVVVDEA